MLSSQRIHTFITTNQHVQSAKRGAGHLATNCINIPTGTRITSKVPNQQPTVDQQSADCWLGELFFIFFLNIAFPHKITMQKEKETTFTGIVQQTYSSYLKA